MGVVDAVLATAGGLIADELKGDFRAARSTAEAALADPSTASEARLALGLVHALAGDSRRAETMLNEAAPTLSGAHAQLAAAMSRLAQRDDEARFPDGLAGWAMELAMRSRPPSQPPPNAPGEPAPDAELVRTTLIAALDFAAETDYPEDTLAALLPQAGPVSEPWRAYAELAAAELDRPICRSAVAAERLAAARERYAALGDAVGVARCDMIEGDWSATGRQSPLQWGFTLSRYDDVSLEDYFDPSGEEKIAAARAAYARAATALAGVIAPRATAALELRGAYLRCREGDAAGAVEQASGARDGFAAAGDSAATRLAAAHAALYQIAAGLPSDAAATAEEIGAWGVGDGRMAHAVGIGLLFTHRGRLWAQAREAERALAALRAAQVLFERLGDQANLVRVLDARAELHRRVGDWHTAGLVVGETLDQGFEAIGDAGEKPRLNQFCIHLDARLGELLQMRDPKRLEKAGELVATVLDRYRKAGPSVGVGFEIAIERRVPAIDVWIPVLSAQEAALLSFPDDARTYSDQAVERAAGHPELLAIAHDELGRRAAARRAYLKGTPLADRSLPMLVRLEAWPQAERALENFPDWPGKGEKWLALDDRGQIREAAGKFADALTDYERAMEMLEQRRLRAGSGTLRIAQTQQISAARPFVHAARAAVKAAEVEPARKDTMWRSAFSYVERGKSRALLDVMAASTDLARSEPARRWREADARLAYSRSLADGDDDARVAADEEALASVEAELAAKAPRWREAVTGRAPLLDADEVAARLDDDTLLLEYAMLDRDLIAFAITRAGGLVQVERWRLKVQRLATATAMLRDACAAGKRSWEKLAEPLQTAMLEPFAALLAEHPRLMLIASGATHRLPFSALRVNGTLLRDSHELSMLPSASALGLLRAGATDSGPLLALGAPADMRYTPPGETQPRPWDELPFAGAAAAYAAGLFAGSVPLLGADATEQNLRMHAARHRLILLATHAEVTESPLRAFLALAGTDGLELHELLGLDLHRAELVVLAACGTDGGSVTGGEEVIGLTRALFVAGAARALVTLWNARAASLPLVLHALFWRLRAGDPPARALAGAQREIAGLDAGAVTERLRELRDAAEALGHPLPAEDPGIETLSHPRHWAPWVLYGR